MFENFKTAVVDLRVFSDEQTETFFWVIATYLPEKVNDALKLLETYRNKLAKKIARVLLAACTKNLFTIFSTTIEQNLKPSSVSSNPVSVRNSSIVFGISPARRNFSRPPSAEEERQTHAIRFV